MSALLHMLREQFGLCWRISCLVFLLQIMDHVSNTDLWSQSGEQRGWKTYTQWDQWHCTILLFLSRSLIISLTRPWLQSLLWIDCVWMFSCFYRCWWRQSLFFAHWAQQWSVWSKLPQGTVWLVDTSANSDAIAGQTDVLLSRLSSSFPETFWLTFTRSTWQTAFILSAEVKILFQAKLYLHHHRSASQRSGADSKLTDRISLLRVYSAV